MTRENVKLECKFELLEDMEAAIVSWICESHNVDHNGQFVGPDGEAKTLTKIHLQEDSIPGLDGGEYYAWDSIMHEPLDRAPYLYLEGHDGSLVTFKSAKPVIPSVWKYGVIFKDEDGQAWFCGHGDHEKSALSDGSITETDYLTADMVKISPHVTDDFKASYGDILEGLPTEGEFWISDEDEPQIISSPFRSGYADPVEEGDTWPGRTENRLKEAKVIECLLERAAAIKAIEAGTDTPAI